MAGNLPTVPILSALQERERTSGLSWSQIETFLALVEEGSIARASRRLGLGRSTLSAHIKTLGEELNPRLFARGRDGLAITPAGLEAYGQLRPLMVRAGYCMTHFHSNATPPPRYVNAVVPHGFPGALIDRAIVLAGKAIADRSATWLSPAYGIARQIEQDALVFGFGGLGHRNNVATPGTRIRDRWVVVRAGHKVGWSNKTIRLSELTGLTIAVPKLPEAQLAILLSLAEAAKAQLNFSGLEMHEIFAEALQNPRFIFAMPAGLLNPVAVPEQFACAVLEQSELDPEIFVTGSTHAKIAADIAEGYANLLGGLLAQGELAPAEAGTERLSLKYCRSFVALYEDKSVRRAAQRLCIVQPALTVQLHGLEEFLKRPLFFRSHRGLRPNAHGEMLYSLVGPLLAEFGSVVRSLRELQGGRPRRLRLGLIPAVDAESEVAEIFAGALDRWSSENPQIVVQVLEGFSAKLLNWLASGRVDLALIDRIAEHPDMMVEPVAEDRMVVIVERSAELLRPGPVTLADAGKLPLVLPSSRHGLRSLLSRSARKAGIDLEPRIEVDSMAAAISLVKRGRYATILPAGAIYKSRDRRRLSIHEISEPRIVRNICLARMQNGVSDSVTQDFVAELRAAFSQAGEFDHEALGRARASRLPPSVAGKRLSTIDQ